MTKGEAVIWLITIMSEIGNIDHQDLWKYWEVLRDIKNMLEEMEGAEE